jgi:predicted DNA-binding protein with PD1-like motif
LLSIVGDITQDEDGDGPKVHAHVVVGLRDGTTRGGHLLHGAVNPTLEVILVESPAHLRRRHDDQTGLALIEL